ncbi:MAG: AraC family transcriptional regulator [Bacillota bacterium]
MFYEEKIPWIKNTPLGIRVRNIEFVPTHMHENIVEIILCLKGSVKFSYGFEEFTLSAGEFISVDKDAHFFYGGDGDNICVSFYINLEWFLEKYPFITSLLFACEATQESGKPYPTQHHKQMKGTLIAILFYLANNKNRGGDFQNTIINGAERIVDMLLNHFDIVYYYNPGLILKAELMERNRNMMVYLQAHSAEKITLETMSHDFNLTKAYISEFLRTFEIGFRKSLSYIRANKSERMLLSTDMNIMDISEACGFSDPKYYYSAFNEWYKCTPRQFRKIYRDKMNAESKEIDLDLNDTLEPLNEMILKHYLDLFLF